MEFPGSIRNIYHVYTTYYGNQKQPVTIRPKKSTINNTTKYGMTSFHELHHAATSATGRPASIFTPSSSCCGRRSLKISIWYYDLKDPYPSLEIPRVGLMVPIPSPGL